jgi:hypothetical protein
LPLCQVEILSDGNARMSDVNFIFNDDLVALKANTKEIL